MLEALYKQRLERDLPRWQQEGWVNDEQARAILKDVRERASRSHLLPMVITGVGLLALALAVAAFIAANWEVIPRMVKLIGMLSLLVVSVGGAFACKRKGWDLLSDILCLVASLIFFSGLALVGQIYNLPQDWPGGLALGALGALAAAFLGGSRMALLVALVALFTLQFHEQPAVWIGWLATAALPLAIGHVLWKPNLVGRWFVIFYGFALYYRWVAQLPREQMVFAFEGTVLLAACLLMVGMIGTWWAQDRVRWQQSLWLSGMSLQSAGLILALFVLFFRMLVVGDSLVSEMNMPREGLLEHMWSYAELTVMTPQLLVPALIALVGLVAGLVLSVRVSSVFALPTAITALVMASVLAPGLPFALVFASVFSLTAGLLVVLRGVTQDRVGWLLLGIAALCGNSLWLLYETIGDLLGQSLFFFICGVILIVVGIGTARFLRRRRATDLAEKGA
ncbi:DUF2157 domain-containing protein [Pseudovibrio sp. SPO723]|uniref:DUF2157 domain-containing protein n=1 Tax=Nesiotobacter zosterae TaxID=392721 RepID=UPI0029C313E2|nr:DUF2157 domain-containing protein [Pseudovibrio sp. SPO723]MDX5594510.1 DUF2157 domain-containing protein [Pseudovibrio sp. SPO723]